MRSVKGRLLICFVAALLVLGSSSVLAQVEVTMPDGGATQLPDGNWEYVYDTTITSPTTYETFEIPNPGGLIATDRWDCTAAGHGFFDPAALSPPYPTWSDSGYKNEDNPSWDSGSGTMNVWHSPIDYADYYAFHPAEKNGFVRWEIGVAQEGTTGLVGTFRIVSSRSPTAVEWSAEGETDGLSYSTSGDTVGPSPELPPSALLLLGAFPLSIAYLRGRRREE